MREVSYSKSLDSVLHHGASYVCEEPTIDAWLRSRRGRGILMSSHGVLDLVDETRHVDELKQMLLMV